MLPRSRILLTALAGVLAMAVLAVVAVGLRSARSASAPSAAAPLLRPRFTTAPRLRLGLLSRGSLPAAGDELWRRAAADRQIDLTELHGRPLVINFWASWCDPCRREAPLLERAWQRRRGGTLFLGVNQNDLLGDARGFLRRFAITYPSVREGGDATGRRWGVAGFPVTFFVAADGHVVAQAIGLLRPTQLERGIEAARTDSFKS